VFINIGPCETIVLFSFASLIGLGVVMEMEEESRKRGRSLKNLRVFNFSMGILHLIQGVLMVVLSNRFSLPVTTNFLSYDKKLGIVKTATKEIANIRIGPFVASFLFISAVAHLILTAPRAHQWYLKNLKRGINYARWAEYFFSSSIMIVIIALLSGMYDLPSLILIFSLNGTMILFGLVMEVHNQTTEKTNWTAFACGCFAGIIPWVAIAMYFFGAALESSGSIPTFVYFILLSLFIFFNIFAVNMVLQYKKVGPWKDYVFGERVYIILSLTAKSALAWQVFSGTLRPQ